MQRTIWIVVSVMLAIGTSSAPASAEPYDGTAGNDVMYFGYDYTQGRVEMCINGATFLPTIVDGDLPEDLVIHGLGGNDTITVAGASAPSWNPTACGQYRAFVCSGEWWILLYGDTGNDKVVGGMQCPTIVRGNDGDDQVWVRMKEGYVDGGAGKDKVISYVAGGDEFMWGSEGEDCLSQQHPSPGPAFWMDCGGGTDRYHSVWGSVPQSCETWTTTVCTVGP